MAVDNIYIYDNITISLILCPVQKEETMREYKKIYPKGASHKAVLFSLIIMFGTMIFALMRAFRIRGSAEIEIVLFMAGILLALVAVMYCIYGPMFFMRFCTDYDGIHAKCPLLPKKFYSWDDIRTYGISAKSKDRKIFFSLHNIETDIREKEEFLIINSNRIVISLCDEYWQDMKIFMPQDMVNPIESAKLKDERQKFTR